MPSSRPGYLWHKNWHTWQLVYATYIQRQSDTCRLTSSLVQLNYNQIIIIVIIAYLSYEARIRHLKLPSLLQRRVYLDLIFIYKCLHQLTAISVNSLGLSVISSTTRGNGIRLNYFIPKTLLLSTSFRCRAAQAWNTLPTTIVTLPTLSKFKVALKRHLNMPL